ncbi:DUF1579 domain-containing protein [Microbaculum marinum]|uniref:DUF1579 domain-containing protein n=1 Tax=Microbaculum marinum TaxID=1764581 RepID=A0AAW9RQC1_9HYPH
MMEEPSAEHRWLEQLVGEWEIEAGSAESDMAEHRWTESVRTLNGLWIVAEGKGEMPDGTSVRTLMTLGYDPRRGKYVGNWIGSMMSHMWVYEGELDASGRVLPLDCEGPDFSPEGSLGLKDGELGHYQDVITIEDENTRTLTGRVKMPDGTWNEFMTARYRRVSPT